MNRRQHLSLSAIAAFTLGLTACGGGGSSNSNNPTPPAAISVAFSAQPPSSLVTATTTGITAIVSNDTKSAGVTWTVTCGSAACGSFSPASTASGAATTFTAPAAVPTNNTVTVTATSVTDTTKTATATITIGAPPAILADGTYVYHYAGYVSTGPAFFAGAFTVAGGAITGGEQDYSDTKNGFTNQLVASGSSLSAAGSNIQIVLAFQLQTNQTLGVNGVVTLRGKAVSASRVLISEFDSFAVGTGSLDLQTSPLTAPSGGYAFVVSGLDIGTSQNNPLTIGGVLNVSGTTISITGSVFDYNLAGNVGLAQLFQSGSVTTPDSFGRVTFTLTPTSTSGVPAFILTGYIVGPGQIQLVESQTDKLSDDLGGMALGQGSKAGQFSQASIANTTYVFAASGDDINGLATYAGGFVFGSSGGVSGNLAINDFTFFSGNTLSGGNYTVDPTGRVTVGSVAAAPANATFSFMLYLDGSGNALVMGADGQEVTSGPSYLQTSTSADFEGTYALRGQGILKSAPSYPAWGAVGPATVSSDNVTGSTDYNAEATTPASAQSLTGTETNSTQQLNLTGLDALSFTSPRLYSYIPIDSKRVFAIEIDGQQLGLLFLETISH